MAIDDEKRFSEWIYELNVDCRFLFRYLTRKVCFEEQSSPQALKLSDDEDNH